MDNFVCLTLEGYQNQCVVLLPVVYLPTNRGMLAVEMKFSWSGAVWIMPTK